MIFAIDLHTFLDGVASVMSISDPESDENPLSSFRFGLEPPQGDADPRGDEPLDMEMQRGDPAEGETLMAGGDFLTIVGGVEVFSLFSIGCFCCFGCCNDVSSATS